MSGKKTKKIRDKIPLGKKSKSRKKQTSDVETTESVPRITSDSVAEHREEVLSGARRFIYPLQHSRNKVVWISTGIIVAIVLGSVLFAGLLLYRYQSTSNFAYQISQIVPFPVARVDGDYVPYENYLFELSYSLFYYQNYDQEGVDIESSEGEQLIRELKLQALEKIKLDKLAMQIAEENDVSVSEEQVQRQIEVIRNQGGIGDSDQALEDILRSSYNWSIDDLERTIRLQLLRQSLPRILDTETNNEAVEALGEVRSGKDFGKLAKKYSDDPLTKDRDGVIGVISRTDTALPPEFIEAAFSLQEGETSDLVESRFGLHIIRVNSVDGDQREVSHILFQYFDIDTFLRDELKKVDVVDYITIE